MLISVRSPVNSQPRSSIVAAPHFLSSVHSSMDSSHSSTLVSTAKHLNPISTLRVQAAQLAIVPPKRIPFPFSASYLTICLFVNDGVDAPLLQNDKRLPFT